MYDDKVVLHSSFSVVVCSLFICRSSSRATFTPVVHNNLNDIECFIKKDHIDDDDDTTLHCVVCY